MGLRLKIKILHTPIMQPGFSCLLDRVGYGSVSYVQVRLLFKILCPALTSVTHRIQLVAIYAGLAETGGKLMLSLAAEVGGEAQLLVDFG
jgi:hypothetical protein